MEDLPSLMARRAAISSELRSISDNLEGMRQEAQAAALSKILELMARHDISIVDLCAPCPLKDNVRKSVPIKYRDAAGNSWNGRGPQPRWLRDALKSGRDPIEFLVE